VSSRRKAGDLYLIISARRLSSHLFSNNYSLFIYISLRVVNLITAINTLLLLRNSMAMAPPPPYLIYNLLVVHLFIHVPMVCYPLYAPKMGILFHFSTSQCPLSQVYNPLISCTNRTTPAVTSFTNPFFLSNFYALPTPDCPLSRLFCYGDVPTRVCISVIQCSNQKSSRLCLCPSCNQNFCYLAHDSCVVFSSSFIGPPFTYIHQ
jgi:hypothetical protein